MRVVHLVHQYPPEFRGGTEACLETLAAEQIRRGDAVLVVAGASERDERGVVRRERVAGVEVARVLRRPGENFSMDERRPRVVEQVLATVAEFRPDVVHVHHLQNLSADLGARLAAAGHPVVATLHDYLLVCARFFLLRPDGVSCAEAFPLPAIPRCVDCTLPDFPSGRPALEAETAAKQATARAE